MHNHSAESYELLFSISRQSFASILIVSSGLANIFLLLILYRAKSTREIKNDCYGYYLCNMCITNLLVSILCIVTSVIYTRLTCKKFFYLLRMLCGLHIVTSSICIETIALMTMERYHVIQNPLRKRKTLSRVKQKIYIIWVWGLINGLPQFFFHKYVDVEAYLPQCRTEEYSVTYIKLYSFFLLFSIIVIPTIIIFVCGIGVLLAYSTESALSLKRRKRYRRFVYFVFALWLSFILTNFPKYLLEISMNLNVWHKDDVSEIIFAIFLLLSWSNYLLVPIIYISCYGKMIKIELWKACNAGNNCSLSHIYQALHPPIFSAQTTNTNEAETYLIRRPLLHINEIDEYVMQHINFELYSDEVNINRNSTSGDGRQSIFRKRLTTQDKHTLDENPFLNALVPDVEHVINKLNQRDSVRK